MSLGLRLEEWRIELSWELLLAVKPVISERRRAASEEDVRDGLSDFSRSPPGLDST